MCIHVQMDGPRSIPDVGVTRTTAWHDDQRRRRWWYFGAGACGDRGVRTAVGRIHRMVRSATFGHAPEDADAGSERRRELASQESEGAEMATRESVCAGFGELFPNLAPWAVCIPKLSSV